MDDLVAAATAVLARSKARNQIQLGTSGLGAGAKPEAGRAAAEEAVDRIRQAIDGSHERCDRNAPHSRVLP